MMRRFSVILPLPPSMNNFYFNKPSGGRRVAEKGRIWRKKCAFILRDEPGLRKREPMEDEITITMILRCKRWRTKDGRIRKNDLDNRIKPVLDVLSGKLWHDDSQIWRLNALKRPADVDEVVVYVERWRD